MTKPWFVWSAWLLSSVSAMLAVGPFKAQLAGNDRVVLKTPQGRIAIRLRSDAAPQSAYRFAVMVKEGLYNDCVFYRAEDFCIQGGLRDRQGKTRTNPFGYFPFEYNLPNKRGTVTLARWQDKNSATGEFFINLKDSPHLDRTGNDGWRQGFTVFGEVEGGMDVADAIGRMATNQQGGMSMLITPIVFQAEYLAEQAQNVQTVQSLAITTTKPEGPKNRMLKIDVAAGAFAISLNPENAPQTVRRLLASPGETGRFHRAEPLPPAGSQGPPYALVQATLSDPELAKIPHEGHMSIRRGSVCLITGSSDVFVALADHPGWENSMTVFGEVSEADLRAHIEQPILSLPRHTMIHPTFGTKMSMLNTPLPITIEVIAGTPALRGGLDPAFAPPRGLSPGAEEALKAFDSEFAHLKSSLGDH